MISQSTQQHGEPAPSWPPRLTRKDLEISASPRLLRLLGRAIIDVGFFGLNLPCIPSGHAGFFAHLTRPAGRVQAGQISPRNDPSSIAMAIPARWQCPFGRGMPRQTDTPRQGQNTREEPVQTSFRPFVAQLVRPANLGAARDLAHHGCPMRCDTEFAVGSGLGVITAPSTVSGHGARPRSANQDKNNARRA